MANLRTRSNPNRLTRRKNGRADSSQRFAPKGTQHHPASQEGTMRRSSQTAVLRTCMDTITECFEYCIQHGGRHVEAHHLRVHLDAWDLLNASSTLIARNSDYSDDLKATCAQAVKDCEESCEEFEGDEMMKACADACREAYEYLRA